jgi:superfamily II DNA/RNA helicase
MNNNHLHPRVGMTRTAMPTSIQVPIDQDTYTNKSSWQRLSILEENSYRLQSKTIYIIIPNPCNRIERISCEWEKYGKFEVILLVLWYAIL